MCSVYSSMPCATGYYSGALATSCTPCSPVFYCSATTIAQCLPLEQIEALSLPEIEKRLIPVYEAAPSVAQ